MILTTAEVARYEERDWTEVFGTPRGVVDRSGGLAFLARQPNGECLFLDADSRCRLHATYGGADKPLACRAFPFTIGPPGPDGKPCAAAHFTCSSVAAGDGQPLASHRKELEALDAERVALGAFDEPSAPRPFAPGREYQRADVERLFDLMAGELEHADGPFSERLLAAVKFVDLVAGSKFASLTTGTSAKAVTSFAKGTRDQVRRGLLFAPPPAPPLPQRILFRLVLAFTARRDSAALATAGWLRRTSRRLANFLAGLTFLAGTGRVRLVGRERAVTLGDVRRTGSKAALDTPEADGALTRYLVAKLTGRFLYDPAFQVHGVLPALGLLLRQVPIVLLLARAACAARGGEAPSRDDYASAVRTADWNFGHIPWDTGLLGGLRGRLLADVHAPLALMTECAGAQLYPLPPMPEPVQR